MPENTLLAAKIHVELGDPILGEIDGLLVPSGKASNLLTDHLITG